jgi:hypothetical protein
VGHRWQALIGSATNESRKTIFLTRKEHGQQRRCRTSATILLAADASRLAKHDLLHG